MKYAWRAAEILWLFLWFLKELVKSCLIVARDCVRAKPRLNPAVFMMPLEPGKSDWEIFVLANMITLTPGTLTLDVTDARDALVIHAIYAEDTEAAIEELKSGMEARVARVFSHV